MSKLMPPVPTEEEWEATQKELLNLKHSLQIADKKLGKAQEFIGLSVNLFEKIIKDIQNVNQDLDQRLSTKSRNNATTEAAASRPMSFSSGSKKHQSISSTAKDVRPISTDSVHSSHTTAKGPSHK